MRRPAWLPLFALALPLAVLPTHAQQLHSRDEPEEPIPSAGRQATETMLLAGKYDELDRLAAHYRQDRTRTKGGDWKLHQFYQALNAPQQTDRDSLDHLNHIREWIKLRPESITARIALASSLRRWAWVARGNGYVNTVTPEGARLYEQRSEEARRVLEQAGELKTLDPQYFSDMLGVAVDQGWSRERMADLLARGTQLEPEYFYLYRQFAYAILPKWYGKPGEASAFAQSAADKLGGDRGDILYFEIAAELIRPGDGDFPVHELDWQRIQRGHAALASAFGTNNHHENQLAFIAWRFHDAPVASAQFASIGDRWAASVWKERSRFDRARDWSHGLNR